VHATREAVQEILARPTEELVARAGSSARATESQVGTWDIDSGARDLLVNFGIPYMEEDGLEVGIQTETDPQIEYSDRSFCRLGENRDVGMSGTSEEAHIYSELAKHYPDCSKAGECCGRFSVSLRKEISTSVL
jgi:hypothetical protein